MPPETRDTARLWDMLDNAKAVASIVAGRSLVEFERDRTLRLATERALEIVGEAARHVSRTFQDAHPEIPWARIIGFRNLLAHEYGEILTARVWEIATRSVPELVALLEPHVPPPSNEV
jgi:uncharacterized protein with HEPN domain